MKKRVVVTKKDIEHRVGRMTCPLERALSRVMKSPVVVSTRTWSLRVDSYSKGRRLPSKALAFLRAFDAGRPVEPFSFTIELED